MRTDTIFELVRDTHASLMWADDDNPPVLADLDGMTLEALHGMLSQLQVIRQAVALLTAQAEGMIASQIGEGGAARCGDTIYRFRPRASQRIVDPQGLIDWLRDDWHQVIPVTRSTTIRKGGLQAVCEQRGIDVQAVLDTFTEWEEGAPTVSRMPVDSAPKFLQAMEDGQVRRA